MCGYYTEMSLDFWGVPLPTTYYNETSYIRYFNEAQRKAFKYIWQHPTELLIDIPELHHPLTGYTQAYYPSHGEAGIFYLIACICNPPSIWNRPKITNNVFLRHFTPL